MRDFRYAIRVLSRSPGFAAASVLTLALGIGANAAIFRFVDAILLRPLPYPEPAQLVAVWQTVPTDRSQGASPANFLDWQSESQSFTALAAFEARDRILAGAPEPANVGVATVSPDFFRVLGVDSARGRTFTRGRTGVREAMIGHELWQSRFGADEHILGQPLLLDREPFEVVGILPRGFGFPSDVSLWIRARDEVPELPIPFSGNLRELRDARYLGVIARLKPEIRLDQAGSEMEVLANRLRQEYPEANSNTGVRLVSLHDDLVGDTRQTLLLMLGVVGFVLLIACANVTNLLLARGAARVRELAIRSALGAGRGRLARQLLTESFVLAVAGCGLGLILEQVARPYVARVLPETASSLGSGAACRPVILFALFVSAGSALLVSLVPALRATRGAFGDALTRGAHSTVSAGGARARGILAAVEVGLSFVLVVGAALLLQTVWRLERVDAGFRTERVLTAKLSFPGALRADPREVRNFYERVVQRVAGFPGTEAVGASQTLPLSGRSYRANIQVQGRIFRQGEAPDVCWRVITPAYFQALTVPLLRGRGFQPSDRGDSQPVSLINASLARLLWPHEDPIGQYIRTGLDRHDDWTTIVGIVGDTPQDGLGTVAQAEMYRPLGQPTGFSGGSMRIVIRAGGDPLALVPALRTAVREVDPRAPISDIETLDGVRRASMAQPVGIGTLLAAFAALALTLALVGLYGVMACLVSERTREFGVRLALGAAPGHLLRLVLGRSFTVVGIGLVIGTAAAIGLTRLLSNLLYGLSPTDPMTLALVGAALGLVGLAASYLPARRAARVDPMVTLRAE